MLVISEVRIDFIRLDCIYEIMLPVPASGFNHALIRGWRLEEESRIIDPDTRTATAIPSGILLQEHIAVFVSGS